jgi:FkbM family methyltransferase
MEEALLMMHRSGYKPAVVIDGGANVGNWTRTARSIFPDATFHLIEPQPGCAESLRQLVKDTPRSVVYHVAITEPGVSRVRMVGGGEGNKSTGSFVAGDEMASAGDELVCPATTLDELLADKVNRADRALLKLDLENHEITALKGAAHLLNLVEVVLTELPFYNVNNAGNPVFADYVCYMRESGFELYDFASLSHRQRDMRLRQGDAIFVRRDSNLLADYSFS